MSKKIPKTIKSYPEGEPPQQMLMDDDGITFEPVKGQVVQVVYWVQYPSYDLIFGVPTKENPYSATEVGFFQIRDTRTKEVKAGYYVDCNEAEEFFTGFKKIIEVGKLISPELWKQHKIKQGQNQETEMQIPRSNTQKDTPKQKKSKK